MEASDSVAVMLTRVVRPGCEILYENALHDFIQETVRQPGQMGVHVLRPVTGSGSREYGIIRIFASRDALERFRLSPEYQAWQQTVSEWTEGETAMKELQGLESWFTAPRGGVRPFPRYKMFLATMLGVYPTSVFLTLTVLPFLLTWPWPLRSLVMATLLVALLTWVVMPFVSKHLQPWLRKGG